LQVYDNPHHTFNINLDDYQEGQANLITIYIQTNDDQIYSVVDFSTIMIDDDDSIFNTTVNTCFGNFFEYANRLINNSTQYLIFTDIGFELIASHFGIKLYEEYLIRKQRMLRTIEENRERMVEIQEQLNEWLEYRLIDEGGEDYQEELRKIERIQDFLIDLVIR